MEKLLDELTEPGAQTNDHGLEGPTDVAVLRSLPGVGRIVAATLLAEASQAIADRDYRALRSYAGVAPVTRQQENRGDAARLQQKTSERGLSLVSGRGHV